MNHNYLKETSRELDEREAEYIKQRYHSSQVYKGLGMTRDMLRYYEELGILSPEINGDNNYREYSFEDIINIMSIDFYKKRGITPKELKKVIDEDEPENYQLLLKDKRAMIAENIRYQKKVLKKLDETLNFFILLEQERDLLQVKEFPLYEIDEEFTSLANFDEYGEKIVRHLDDSEEDIYSNLVKVLQLDNHGYTGSKACFVKQAKKKIDGRQYLEHGEALYVLLDNPEGDEDNLLEKMFIRCTEWADKNQRKFKDVVYLKLKHTRWYQGDMHVCMECWVPLQKKSL